jgi:hypothetical protein
LRRNYLLKHITEGKIEGRIEVMGKQWRCKLLFDDLKTMRGYWKLKEKALNCTLWTTHFGRGYAPVIRDYRMNK